MDNPYFNIFAHPTGRLLNEREPYDLDMEQIMAAALERGCFLEVNAQPVRLDLSDLHCKMAKDMGVKVAISTDAHPLRNSVRFPFGSMSCQVAIAVRSLGPSLVIRNRANRRWFESK